MTLTTTAAPARWMDLSGCEDRFNRSPFQFTHQLAGHPLLQLPRLMQLAAKTAPEDMYYDLGQVEINQRWGQSFRELSLDESIRRIEHAGAWIVLKHAEKDAEYKVLLDEIIGEILQLAGHELERQIQSRSAILFITSPGRITTYHVDREYNFLLQVRGEKQINVFDQTDREVLPEPELERFWTVDNNAGVYKPKYQDRARVFTLQPGTGVHIPVNAPHWLHNGEGVSISVSMNFILRDSVIGNVYRANYFLRKLGIRPVPPGRSPVRDAIKRNAFGAALGTYRAVKRRVPKFR